MDPEDGRGKIADFRLYRPIIGFKPVAFTVNVQKSYQVVCYNEYQQEDPHPLFTLAQTTIYQILNNHLHETYVYIRNTDTAQSKAIKLKCLCTVTPCEL